MKETSHLFSILIISKPKGELNLFICTTKAIFAEIAKPVILQRKREQTHHKNSLLSRVKYYRLNKKGENKRKT